MVRDMREFLPDYLQDFESLQDLGYPQRLAFTGVKLEIDGIRERAGVNISSDEWERIINIDAATNWAEKMRRMLRRYPYAVMEDYEKIFECWISNKFVLTIDFESLSAVLKTTKKQYQIYEYIRAMRDVLPCNMTFSIEYVSEL